MMSAAAARQDVNEDTQQSTPVPLTWTQRVINRLPFAHDEKYDKANPTELLNLFYQWVLNAVLNRQVQEQFTKFRAQALQGFVQYSSQEQLFWQLARTRAEKAFKIKSSKTRKLFRKLGFTKKKLEPIGDDDPDGKIAGNKISDAYKLIREFWKERFGIDLPETSRPLRERTEVSLVWLLLEVARPESEDFDQEPLFELDENQRAFAERRRLSKEERFQEILEHPALEEMLQVGEEGIGESFLRLLHFDVGVLWPPRKEVLQSFARFFIRKIRLKEEAMEAVEDQLSPFTTITEYVASLLPVKIPTYLSIGCPDYSYNEKGIFTFESLGFGIGFVPQHTVRAFLLIWLWLNEWDLHEVVRFKSIIADIEAYSPLNTDAVGETQESFLAKLRQSNQAFLEQLPKDMQRVTETMFLTEVLGGEKSVWDDAFNNALARLEDGDYPDSQLDFDLMDALKKAFKDRRPLYEYWIKEADSEKWEELAYAFFLEQVAQHIVAGKLLTDKFQFFCMLQGERNRLAVFLNLMAFQVVSVFYLIRRTPQYLKKQLGL